MSHPGSYFGTEKRSKKRAGTDHQLGLFEQPVPDGSEPVPNRETIQESPVSTSGSGTGSEPRDRFGTDHPEDLQELNCGSGNSPLKGKESPEPVPETRVPYPGESGSLTLSPWGGQETRDREPSCEVARPVSGSGTGPEPIRKPSLRPYQLAAKAAAELELLAGRSTLVELPTGCGKTVLFAAMADAAVGGLFAAIRAGRRVLVIAHRTELLEQALNKLVTLGLDTAIEQATKRAGRAMVVVASVQTLQRKRLLALDPTEFGLVVVDEVHHAAAKSYRAIVGPEGHFAGVPTLGVTATPDRGDGQALGLEHGGVLESCCYRYELRQAIADGWLVPIRARVVEIKGVSLAGIKTRAGDLDQKELAEVMAEEQAVLGVAIPLLEQAGDRPTVLFAVGVAHAYALAEALNDRRAGCARAAHGELDADTRKEILAAFRRREFQFLINCDLFTEGFDEPIVACVASAAPTKSRAKHMQRVGRGTRLIGLSYAESVANGKPDLLVLDFVGDSGRHRLVSPLDALAPGTIAEDVREQAERMLADGEQDLDTLLEEAERIMREKRAAARKTASADYFARDVNPFFGDEMLPVEHYDKVPLGNEPAHLHLVQQILELTRSAPPKSLTNAEATRLLEALGRRRKLGLVTSQKMIPWLKNYVDVRDLPSDRARRMMAIVERHGWNRGDKAAIRRDLHRFDVADRCVVAFARLGEAIAKAQARALWANDPFVGSAPVPKTLRDAPSNVPIGEQLGRKGMA